MKSWQLLIGIGWILFAMSFFLPVMGPSSEQSLLGWDAMRAALESQIASQVASALSNVIMIATPLCFLVNSTRLANAVVILMVASTLLNSWWFLGYPPERSDLQLGYYFWWLSFAVVSVALILKQRASAKSLSDAAGGQTSGEG